MENWLAIVIVIEVLATLVTAWCIMHEDRLIALEKYYRRRWERGRGE